MANFIATDWAGECHQIELLTDDMISLARLTVGDRVHLSQHRIGMLESNNAYCVVSDGGEVLSISGQDRQNQTSVVAGLSGLISQL